ncbi:NAD-dependent protein deacetylase sirtuin-1-like [Oscarella lobularis]|uniref:NAD-dependent protein deacetylase sirtuin-1-like n=1 Tax=Oscarella lobularis TaxID=121494 RepID=UPI0033140146
MADNVKTKKEAEKRSREIEKDDDDIETSMNPSKTARTNVSGRDDASTGSNDVTEVESLDFDVNGLNSPDEDPVGPYSFVQRHIVMGTDPRDVLKILLPRGVAVRPDLSDFTLWKIVIEILTEPRPRPKLAHVNTIDDALSLLKSSQRILVLTGAGVSVSCGIPDFRSRNGIYARLAEDFPDLPSPQAMFDINFFRHNPLPFFKFAKEIYPGQFRPSLSHRFISLLESKNKLLRNYTQNIDTLEQVAGISRVVQCHGSFATASCMQCKYKVSSDVIKDDIFNQVIPKCPRCSLEIPVNPLTPSIMKPDIVFFGEGLSEEFFTTFKRDEEEVDLLIVIGSSLKVKPVAMIPNLIPEHVPQILINREPLMRLNFDIELLGNCDEIINYLLSRLGDEWDHAGEKEDPGIPEYQFEPPNKHLFPGAELIPQNDTSSSSSGSDDDDEEEEEEEEEEEKNNDRENVNDENDNNDDENDDADGEPVPSPAPASPSQSD